MGILRGFARTPVVTGSATSLSRRVSRRQALLWLERVEDADDVAAAQELLQSLHEEGLLRDEELIAARGRMSGS